MKKALVAGIAVMMSGMVSMSAYAGWQYTGNQWRYENNGSFLTGWQMIGGEWYYLRPDGSMAFDQWIDAYYVGSNGAMAKNTWVGPYYVGADGKWIPNYGGGGKTEEAADVAWLKDLTTFDEDLYNKNRNTKMDPFGNSYKANSSFYMATEGYATYYVNGKYQVFSGVVAPNDEFGNKSNRTFIIEGDGEELYSLEIERTTEPESFEVDIEGYKYVTIKLIGGVWYGNSHVILDNMCFSNY